MKFLIGICLLVTSVVAAKIKYPYHPAYAQGRVVNGHDARKGEAPFIVSLEAGSHFCAGSIIAPNWVLTAAHCLIYEHIDVVAGLHSLNDNFKVQTRSTTLTRAIKHELWQKDGWTHDIGLVYVPEPFDLAAVAHDGSIAVAKIALPTSRRNHTNSGKLYGWGYTDNTWELPSVLQVLDVNIIDYEQCRAELGEDSPVRPTMVCTHKRDASDGSCSGDSGGPLVSYANGRAELVGIVSWGYMPCLGRTSPSAYTKVTAYKKWIHRKTGLNL